METGDGDSTMRCGERRGAASARGFGNSNERSMRGGRIFRFDSFAGPLDCFKKSSEGSGFASRPRLLPRPLLLRPLSDPVPCSLAESRKLKWEYRAKAEPDGWIFLLGSGSGGAAVSRARYSCPRRGEEARTRRFCGGTLGFAGATGKVVKPLLFLDLVSGDRIKVGRRVRRFSSRSLLLCCTGTSDVPSIFCALDVLCSFRLS